MNLFLLYTKQVIQQALKGNIISYKYYQRWKQSLDTKHNSIVDEQPWLTFPAQDILHIYVRPDTKVFEFGGGGSTLYFVNHAMEVITVEHDSEWFTKLQSIIAQKKGNNWQGNLIAPEPSNTANLDPANPAHYYSSDAHYTGHIFKSYTTAIDKYPDGYFDLVLVDGRSRPSCIQHSIPKVKKKGLLVVDNSDRSYYFTFFRDRLQKEFKEVYNKKKPGPYINSFFQTSIWEKQ